MTETKDNAGGHSLPKMNELSLTEKVFSDSITVGQCCTILCFQGPCDYDNESGVYLGPGRTFDDEDLEYLSKDVDEEDKRSQVESFFRPPSPLVVDEASGIYIGFQEDEVIEVHENGKDEDKEEIKIFEKVESESTSKTKSRSRWSLPFFKSSKYRVQGENQSNFCFRFVRKIWKKSDICG